MTQVGPSSSSSTLQAYVRHDGLVSGIAHVLKNAMKARMPIWKNVGRKELLGGEYVFVRLSEKDIQCIWAHRMCNTAGHEEITDVMYHAAKSVFVRSNQGVVPDCESTNRTSNSSATAGEQVQLPFSDADALLDPATSPSVSPEDDTESWSIDESFEASSEDTKRSEWRSTRDSQFLVLREKKRRRRVGGLADVVAAEEGESEGLGKGKGDREEGPDADEVNIYSTR
ncbi:hypothetical protein D9757_011193 [Collybiopsis confluens]|uniref:Uncharacterized protein n=1 Tax=Collybiopsis confluens TaxID=2823264 RepID=A0A8H5H368_9AGAR|nr:hypothetical protein D9757_011193 [Collybiopsis confluens]